MSVSPSGIFSQPIDALRQMVAESAAFQSWTGSADAATAIGRVHVVNLPESGLVRPFALVDWGEKWQAQTTGTGSGHFFETRGELFLLFEDAVDPVNAASDADAAFAFTNRVGAVLSDLMAAAGSGGTLGIVEIDADGAPERSPPDALDDLYQARFVVTWAGI